MQTASPCPLAKLATQPRRCCRYSYRCSWARGYASAPLLLVQLPLRLRVWPNQLRPIEALPNLTMPILIASGTQDAHTTFAETQRIFDAANQPKLLWKVEGAGHVDLQHHDPAAYENIVLPFLRQYLQAK